MKASHPIDENESEEDALSEARELIDSNPVAVHNYCTVDVTPRTLAPKPEIKAIIYAGKMSGCLINLLSKLVACSFWVLASSRAGSPLDSSDRKCVLKEI